VPSSSRLVAGPGGSSAEARCRHHLDQGHRGSAPPGRPWDGHRCSKRPARSPSGKRSEPQLHPSGLAPLHQLCFTRSVLSEHLVLVFGAGFWKSARPLAWFCQRSGPGPLSGSCCSRFFKQGLQLPHSSICLRQQRAVDKDAGLHHRPNTATGSGGSSIRSSRGPGAGSTHLLATPFSGLAVQETA